MFYREWYKCLPCNRKCLRERFCGYQSHLLLSVAYAAWIRNKVTLYDATLFISDLGVRTA